VNTKRLHNILFSATILARVALIGLSLLVAKCNGVQVYGPGRAGKNIGHFFGKKFISFKAFKGFFHILVYE